MPGQQLPALGNLFSFDKLAHLGVFAILSFMFIVGFTKQFTYLKLRRNAVKYSMIISLSYALILEAGQSIVPGRYTNFYDMAFNTIGVLLGYLFYLLVYKFSFD
jgi:VanZ family protein